MTESKRKIIRAEFKELQEERCKNDKWRIETTIKINKTHSIIDSSIDVSVEALYREMRILDLVDFCNTSKYPS